MLSLAFDVAFTLLGLSLALTLVRVVRGPDVTDRILALDCDFAGTDPQGEPFHAIAAKVADWLAARKGK